MLVRLYSILKKVVLYATFVSIPFGIIHGNQYNFGHIDYTNGLSHNHILSFAEDNNGFMWIGTTSGLNRYDGYNIKVYKHDQSDSTSIPENTVQSIVKDQLGRLWMQLPNSMTIFNPNTEEFLNNYPLTCEGMSFNLYNIDLANPYGDSTIVFRVPGIGILGHNIYTNKNWLLQPNTGKNFDVATADVAHLTVSGQLLYITHRNGIIDIVNIKERKLVQRIHTIQKTMNNVDHEYELFVDHAKNLWVYSKDEALGIYRIEPDGNVRNFTTESSPALNSNIITGLVQDSENNYWIGTDHGGLNILTNDLRTVNHITHESHNDNSLSQNVITNLYKSEKDIIWIGTFKKGVNYYHKNLFRFFLYTKRPNVNSSLSYNDVNCFAEDQQGNIWIGTNGKGLIYFNRAKNEFTTYQGDPDNPNNLNSNVIVSLYVDDNNKLWIGTYYGGLSVYDGNQFTHYMHDRNDPKSISSNKVWDIYEDSEGNLWIGMLGGGLDLFNREQKVFHHYSGDRIHALNTDFVMDIAEDDDGNIWFGTDYGIFVLDKPSSRFIHLAHDEKDVNSLSNDFVYNVFKDSKGNMWAGTRNGLNLYDKETDDFIKFSTQNGLPDNAIMSIQESEMGNLWIGTSNGLCKMILEYDENNNYLDHYTVNFNESDGLQGREFNEGSSLKTSDGELIFGGPNGFNLFKPDEEDLHPESYVTHIVGLEIFGEEVKINQKGNTRKIIRSAILNDETVKLAYKENMFSLKFVTVNFLGAKKINYRYKLEGFNDQWIYTNWQDRKATFTNLNPGKYTFKVQSSDYKSDWYESESSLDIIIHPPWYRTWIAYVVYSMLLLGGILLFRKILIIEERNRYQKEQAIKESERQHELNMLKTRFFTNVSHEFRTPLSLIITPLEGLLKTELGKDTRKHLELMYQNAKRLLNLVNQLLDFRKAEENKLEANFIYGNIIGLINQTVESFADLRESKEIELEFLPDEKQLFMQFDRDKVEKIMFNLISNAFKFTPEKGSIKVFTEVMLDQMNNEELVITVEDTGIGISPEHQQKIFDRFYQTDLPNQFITKGSGIGLALTKEFVELHNGSISVESSPENGSRFIVKLPINRNQPDDHEPEDEELAVEDAIISPEEEEEILMIPGKMIKKAILLVEDNQDFRFYLKDNLLENYNILEAENGKEALDLLKSKQPDLIVSDVMMPEIDGFQLCEEIKTNASFSHIPIILLTAKSTQQDKIEGLKHGADEYLTKPFSLEILESRIQYLLNLRQKFIKHYQKSFQVDDNSKTLTQLDEKLLKKTFDLVNENLSNAEFSVEKLSKELGMSRVYLYKKISSLTGKTPIELIRLVRLKKAAELLVESQLTISEITYEVGFSDPRYFSKQFKAEFQELPSKYRENQGI